MKRQYDEADTEMRAATPSPGTDPSRRGFLRTVGAGTLALGGASLSGTLSPSESTARLVFIYDDGYREDYTETFSVHQQMDVPACAAVPSSNVGQSEQFLTADQLGEMTGAGWEVLSHGVEHEALGAVQVTQAVESGDERVYVDSTVHGRVPREVELLAGDKRAVARIDGKGEDDTGGYLTLKSAVDESFETGARVRYTEAVTRSVLENSRASLGEQGFDVSSLVLPYGRYDDRTLSLAEEYYDSVANVRRGGINGGTAAQPYRLSRAYFREDVMTEQELTDYMDKVASRNALGVLGGHSRNPNLTGERIQLAIELAQERDIEIVTLRTALSEFGLADTSPTDGGTATGNDTGSDTASPDGDENGGGSVIDRFFDWLMALFS